MMGNGKRLAGKVAIVTGAAQGLGRAYAVRLAAEGASVAVVDLNTTLAMEVAGQLERGIGLRADVSVAADTLAMAEKTLEAFGRIDILVNNAGGSLVPARPFFEMPEEDWDLIVNVNLKGQWLCSRAVFPAMREAGSGKIINISSATVLTGYPVGLSPYVSAKGGVIGLTRALARELGPYNINVNAVSPGFTPVTTAKQVFSSQGYEDLRQRMITEQCIARSGLPEDLAGAVLYLASEDSNFVTGQVLNVDGGWAMH